MREIEKKGERDEEQEDLAFDEKVSEGGGWEAEAMAALYKSRLLGFFLFLPCFLIYQ